MAPELTVVNVLTWGFNFPICEGGIGYIFLFISVNDNNHVVLTTVKTGVC